tara:strand:+ start:117 stop:650 length:534 start_codon:yes stop_codon:yes gene_type:complete
MRPTSLKTPRLTLRCPKISDVDALTTAIGDQRVSQWLARVPHPYSHNDAIRWIEISADNWQRNVAYPFNAFFGDRLIGGVGVTRCSDEDAVLGYWLVHDCWGQGYGLELIEAIAAFSAETLGFQTLTAGIHPDNTRSERLLLKAGFEAIGEQIYLHPPPDNRLKGPHFRLSLAGDSQ